MNILVFTNLFPNCSSRNHGSFVFERARGLRNRGHFVEVIAPVPYFPRKFQISRWLRNATLWSRWEAFSRVPAKETRGTISVHHPRYCLLPTLSMPAHGMLMFLGSVILGLKLHRERRFDCIDAHYVYPDSFAAALLGKLLDVPVVVTAHGSDICLYPTSTLLKPIIRWTLSRAAKVVSVSEAMKTIMVDQLGVSPNRIEVIHNGVDTRRFRPQKKEQARRKLGIPLEAKVAISVAALVPSKRHELLLHAVPSVLEVFPTFRLYLIGQGRMEAHLRTLVDQLRLGNHVFFIGEIANAGLKYWYSAADVTCLASHREGFPCVLLESLACGTPVMASAVGGIPEIVSSDVGVLLPPNLRDLGQALVHTLSANWSTARLLEKAATFTWDKAIDETSRILAQSVSCRSIIPRGQKQESY